MRELNATQQVAIPEIEKIASMPLMYCQWERIRLKNEISFARGDALWGGPSSGQMITALKQAVDAIERRLSELTRDDNGDYIAG